MGYHSNGDAVDRRV
ncbi:hypothetical protein BDFB_000433 [Asbolus verrucosus]|uniref:Uncharacterized protein n=1 Tax=Asbolus verrucosus TaxID=1661398 RepID=A0A482W8I6_ASBVE|nr:hypothetical protein BDFB_000433 [Asbolus verrucosus]